MHESAPETAKHHTQARYFFTFLVTRNNNPLGTGLTSPRAQGLDPGSAARATQVNATRPLAQARPPALSRYEARTPIGHGTPGARPPKALPSMRGRGDAGAARRVPRMLSTQRSHLKVATRGRVVAG